MDRCTLCIDAAIPGFRHCLRHLNYQRDKCREYRKTTYANKMYRVEVAE